MALNTRRWLGWTQFALALVVGVAIWGMASVLLTRPGISPILDLTPQSQLSLSDDTVELLRELRRSETPIELHTFFEPLTIRPTTEELRHLLQIRHTIQEMTRDLLRLYQRHGGDLVRVVHHDLLREVQQSREAAESVALSKVNTLVVRLGKRSRVLSLDEDLARVDWPRNDTPMPGARATLPTLEDYKGEEALSSTLKGLQVEGTPKVYFLGGAIGTASITEGVAEAYSELAGDLADEGFAIHQLDLDRHPQVPDDAAVLAIVEPRYELTDGAAKLVVDYLRRGGRLLVNVAYRDIPPSWNPSLSNLLRPIGVELGNELVCQLVPDPRDPNNPNNPGIDGVPGVQALTLTEINVGHPITRPLVRQQRSRVVTMTFAREIRRAGATPPEGVTFDPLLQTGRYAWNEVRAPSPRGGHPEVDLRAPRNDFAAFAPRAVAISAEIQPTEGERPGIVVIVSGRAFANIARGQNGDFALNTFQYLAERRQLIGVRGNRYVSRRLEAAPQQLDRIFDLLVLGVPGVLFGLGAIVLFLRSRS